ncbi:hypothetical protein MHW99_07190 [Corynebacterium sp. ACRPX]|uniref:hypothetical protein n=1 Tax=Corynebacterium sp. ACRPX TaxID=2918185 RepID=UPI001EF4B703|nr:hypothetical protein [Corynebacterium sp. ACRPX]MCG7245619.1 hypothetical protein [Corynebacterium sp. ACRPX]
MSDYTPADSLAYLNENGLIDVAIEALYSLADDMSASEQADLAVAVLETLQKILAYEVRVHRLDTATHYSNGIPLTITGLEPYDEIDTDGVRHTGSRPITTCMHPSGAVTHPAINNGWEVA